MSITSHARLVKLPAIAGRWWPKSGIWAIIPLLVALCAGFAGAAELRVVAGHVPARTRALAAIGRLDPKTNLQLAIGLPLRDAAGLTNLLRQLQNPASPLYRQYLTPEQFAERFGPSTQDYEAVVAFAQAQGLRVTERHLNRLVLSVLGTAENVERAFHVTLQRYPHPTETRTFFAPTTEPSVDSLVPILHVSGLDDLARPQPRSRARPFDHAGIAPLGTGSGPSGGFIGRDFRKAYVPDTLLDGAGQSVGLLQFDGYYASDIANYIADAGIVTSVVLTNVAINGGVATPGINNAEVCLDIEMAIAMAPGLSRIIVYEAPNPSPWVDLLSRMANDNLAQQLSCSWGGGPPDATAEQIFLQMAAQGQSFFNASGDADAFTSAVAFPADSPNIVQVGGTTLTMSGTGEAYAAEVVWNRGNGVGSGGGISTYYALPDFQQGVSMAINQGSTVMRNIPDVAMVADNIYVRYNNGGSGFFGGTSCAAPLWAGFAALANQQAANVGVPPLGSLNPLFYALGRGTNAAAVFHDVTIGNNFSTGSPARFAATSGYDLCTGWGTPAGGNLIQALISFGALRILPVTIPAFSGPVGGPFDPETTSLVLTNASTNALTWSAGTTSTWFTLTPSSGTLPAGGATNVVVGLMPAADGLEAQIYSGMIEVIDQTSGATQFRSLQLRIGQSLILNGGFETGDARYWAMSGPSGFNRVFAATNNYPGWGNGSDVVHSGNYGLAMGAYGSLAYISQVMPTSADRFYLLSFWVQNWRVGTPNEFLVQWGDVMLFDQVNMSAFGWTNMQFVVLATNQNMRLTFGGRNDPKMFGLDDIRACALAWPVLDAIEEQTNTVTLAWSASTNLHYQAQYTTNLGSAPWVNLGAPVLGTSGTMMATDPSPSSPQRFYRMLSW